VLRRLGTYVRRRHLSGRVTSSMVFRTVRCETDRFRKAYFLRYRRAVLKGGRYGNRTPNERELRVIKLVA